MPILLLLPLIVVLNFGLAWHGSGVRRFTNALAGVICALVWLWYMSGLFAVDI